MDKIASGIVDKLSIIGFFNVILSGGVLLYGISPVLDQYVPGMVSVRLGLENDLETGIVVCLACYILGSALQGIQGVLFKGLKSGVVNRCLSPLAGDGEGAQSLQGVLGLQPKPVLSNVYRREGLIRLASALFTQKDLGNFDPEDPEMCSYFFDLCENSNLIRGYGTKAGKLSESASFYEQLTAAFFVLAACGVIVSVFTDPVGLLYCALYLLMGSVFLGRAYQCRLDWARNVLATYEAAADKAESEKVNW